MGRPKMKATRDKGENEKKEKRKAPSDAGVSPPKKKTKPTEQRSLKDIDQTDVNVDEMLNKILAERAKFDKLTGELIFTAKELVAIGANSLEYLSYCYPLGLSMIVQVPVSKILAPTPLYGCRPFNENHMYEILMNIRTKTAVIPQVADLLPVQIKKNVDPDGKATVTEIKLRLTTQDMLREAIANPEVWFYAVSGQHSAYAQKFLQGLAEVPDSVKANNTMRWSRILDAKAKIVDLCKISHLGNEQNVLSRFESSFIELMIQARNQWTHSGSPMPSGQGSKPSRNYEAFMEIASLTLQRGSLREIKEVLLAPEDVWQLFLQVADSWIKCKLTHPVGNIPALSIPNSGEKNYRQVIQQVEKNRKKMRANWFKPFQGMEAKEVKRILEKLMEGKLLLRKSSKSGDARDDLQTFCTWMKIEDRLFEEIIRFFETKFSKGVTRKQLRREYHISRSFLKEIQSLLAEEDVAALKRNAKWKGVPAVLENKLIALHKAATSELISDRKDPFSIIETCGDLTSSKIPVDVSSPQLVIADLTASPEWEKSTFEGMFKVLISLFSKCSDVQFVLVVYLLPIAVSDFLSSFKRFESMDPKITFDYFLGFYEPDKVREKCTKPVKDQGFIKAVVFVTAKGKEFGDCPEGKKITLLSRKSETAGDYYKLKPDGETETQKRTWILNNAPCWNMVVAAELPYKGRVHMYYKRPDDFQEIVKNWSSKGGVVIDIFSGGVLLRAGLKSSRQVISFTRSLQETSFLNLFVRSLKAHCPLTKTWLSSFRTSGMLDKEADDGTAVQEEGPANDLTANDSTANDASEESKNELTEDQEESHANDSTTNDSSANDASEESKNELTEAELSDIPENNSEVSEEKLITNEEHDTSNALQTSVSERNVINTAQNVSEELKNDEGCRETEKDTLSNDSAASSTKCDVEAESPTLKDDVYNPPVTDADLEPAGDVEAESPTLKDDVFHPPVADADPEPAESIKEAIFIQFDLDATINVNEEIINAEEDFVQLDPKEM
ncbi:hypothetical protein R1sor_004962 [Riccia sorocarpa]|uniref:Uncharacterized protein n=1 Tax=Riccia sorocarpa TaxID=122646 RepID=A0ABD3HKD6_9MARC